MNLIVIVKPIIRTAVADGQELDFLVMAMHLMAKEKDV